MPTIVISVQTPDVDLVAREPLVITINERFQDVAAGRAGETNGAAEPNEAASPFWTWFIENPRPTAPDRFREA